MDRTYLDCMLMITEAAIDYVSDTQSYAELVYWLNQHGELCDKLYGGFARIGSSH